MSPSVERYLFTYTLRHQASFLFSSSNIPPLSPSMSPRPISPPFPTVSVQITTALRHAAIGESSGDGLDDHASVAEDGTQDSSMHSTATTPSPNLTTGAPRTGSNGRPARGSTLSSGSSSRGFDYASGMGMDGVGAGLYGSTSSLTALGGGAARTGSAPGFRSALDIGGPVDHMHR
jgi:hypothetical protein